MAPRSLIGQETGVMTANHETRDGENLCLPVKNGAKNGMPAKEAKWAAEIAAMGAAQAVIGAAGITKRR